MTQLAVELRHAKRSQTTFLDLSERALVFVPKEVYSISTLIRLDLSHNKISHLEPQIINLTQLEELNLSDNELTQLPMEIAELKVLKSMNLGGNPLGQRFQILIEAGRKQNLQQALQTWKTSAQQISSSAPSWLTESNSRPSLSTYQTEQRYSEGFSLSPKKKVLQPKRHPQMKPMQVECERQEKNNSLVILANQLQMLKEGPKLFSGALTQGVYCGLKVTIKEYSLQVQQSPESQLQSELSFLVKYRHPHIIMVLGACYSPPLLITQRFEGTLWEKMKKGIHQSQKESITVGILQAIAYLHRHRIIHGSISPFSFVFDAQNTIKLVSLEHAIHQSQIHKMTSCGHHYPEQYRAPQLQQGKPSLQSDMFAVGSLLYELNNGSTVSENREFQQKKFSELCKAVFITVLLCGGEEGSRPAAWDLLRSYLC